MKRPAPKKDLSLAESAKLVAELCEVESGLWSREEEFVESVAKQVERHRRPMTVSQAKWANAILERLGR